VQKGGRRKRSGSGVREGWRKGCRNREAGGTKDWEKGAAGARR
jgi:hypothetical protein